MKIFLSWSGDRSQAVATLLKNWLRLVIQSLDPWLSSQNIENGSLWFNELTTQLQEITTGILCLTHENKNKPWILFEAGALAKGLTTSRVCTLLIDLEPKDIEPPLSQFNHTKVTRDGLRKLIGDLNARLGDKALEESILTEAFDAHWPRFETQYKAILEQHKPTTKTKARPTEELVSEILENTREILSLSKQTVVAEASKESRRSDQQVMDLREQMHRRALQMKELRRELIILRSREPSGSDEATKEHHRKILGLEEDLFSLRNDRDRIRFKLKMLIQGLD